MLLRSVLIVYLNAKHYFREMIWRQGEHEIILYVFEKAQVKPE